MLNLFLYALLSGLDFSQGEWTLVGVNLPNYAPHPLQARLGAFIINDPNLFQQLQQSWHGQSFYEDYCDYHFVLKFYQNRRLKKTLKINLRCGYATEGVFSYTFRPEWFEALLPHATPIVWSKVWFHKNENLRPAVAALLEAPDVYFYEEPEPYLYEGRFIIAVDSVSWRVDRDSLYQAVKSQVEGHFPPGKAYVRPYFFYLDDKFLLYFRFEVFCDREDYETYKRGLSISVPWQPHVHPGEAKRLIIIGVNRERFRRYVNAWKARYGAQDGDT